MVALKQGATLPPPGTAIPGRTCFEGGHSDCPRLLHRAGGDVPGALPLSLCAAEICPTAVTYPMNTLTIFLVEHKAAVNLFFFPL